MNNAKQNLIAKVKATTENKSFESAFFLMLTLEDTYYNYELNFEEFIEIKKELVKAFNLTHGLFFPCNYSQDVSRENLVNLVLIARKFD